MPKEKATQRETQYSEGRGLGRAVAIGDIRLKADQPCVPQAKTSGTSIRVVRALLTLAWINREVPLLARVYTGVYT